MTTPLSGAVPAGQTVEIDVHTSEAVNVVGTPTLALSDKGVANYVSGSGTNTLVFDYVVAAGQNTADLLTTSLKNAKGGTITDLAGNVLNLTGAAKQDLHLVVDTIAPLVSSVVSSPSTGAVAAGADVLITLNLNDKATVTGSPTLGLSDGATAAYVSGSGTNALIFKYHVGSESTTDLQVTGINRLTAEIGLVSYTLLILFRNMLTGLRGVPYLARSCTTAHSRNSPASRIRSNCPSSTKW